MEKLLKGAIMISVASTLIFDGAVASATGVGVAPVHSSVRSQMDMKKKPMAPPPKPRVPAKSKR